MKPLILSTRNIIPTGNKERPVVVRRTWSSTLINVLLGVLLLTFSVLHICVSGVEHTFRFYFTSALSAHVILMYFTHAVKGEHPENNLDTEEFTCLQQYALFIWKERLKSASLAVALICCCFSDDDLIGVIGILFLAFFFITTWYFKQQIKLAGRLAPDLNLSPRIQVVLGLSPLAAKLEKVALASMAVAVGVGLWGGLSSFLNDSNSGMLIWGLCLPFCAVGVTFSLRKMMRQPISLADQDEANEVMRDRWIVPLISLCLNVIGSIVFVAFRLFC